MTTLLRSLSAAALLSTCLLTPAFAQYDKAVDDRWIPSAEEEEAIRASMERHKVPGVGMAIIRDGKVVWNASYGVTNIETGQKVDDDTLFQGASLTKPAFAYVVMKLVEEGKLSLDDKLADYLYPEQYPDDPKFRKMTVEHVLEHHTGMPNWRDRDDAEGTSLIPEAEPGTEASYSGEAFMWLMEVVELIEDKGIAEIMQERLFEPAKLSDTYLLWTPENDEREVWGHEIDEEGNLNLQRAHYARRVGSPLYELAERWDRPVDSWNGMEMRAALRTMDRSGDEGLQGIPLYQLTSASYHLFDNVSSIRTTPSDFAKFLTLMMDDKRRKRWEISNATREDMLTPQYERTFSSENLPQGIGWGIERRAEGNYFYHGGNNNNTYVSLALGANDGSHGMVIMTNGPEGWSVIEDVTKLLAGVEFDCVY